MAEKIQYAGEVITDSLELLTSSGSRVDISEITNEINIFEDIFSNTIQGSIIIGDTENILTNFNIIGQEFLKLKIRTPGLTKKSEIIDFTANPMFVYKINLRASISSGAQMYELLFTSQETIKNQLMRVSKSYKDSIQNIVVDIMRNKIKTDKDIFISGTLGSRKLIAPNVHPFAFIDKLKRESISAVNGSTEFLFYENKDGYHFTSLSSLYSKPANGEFNDGDDALDEDKEGGSSIIASFKRIIEYSIGSNKDFVVNVVGGMMGSQITEHNIYNKSYEKTNYSYFNNFNDHPRIDSTESKQVYNDRIIEDFGTLIKSNIKLHPTSSVNNLDAQHYEDGNTVYATNRAKDWMLHRQSRITELNNSSFINMTVHGITNLKVGDIIEANFPVVGNDHKDYKIDPFLSGRYLISKLRHTISPATKTHEINMQIVRDCGTIDI